MKSKINPKLGISDAALRSQIRSALRKCWRYTSRKEYVKKVRFPHKGSGRNKYDVKCEACGAVMGLSERKRFKNADGTLRKKETLAYQVHHKHGNPPFLKMADLSAYAESLIFGEMELLCFLCHAAETKTQRAKK